MTEVEARRPGTKGELLRLGGLRAWVGGWLTTVVAALSPGTKGQLLWLKGQQ